MPFSFCFPHYEPSRRMIGWQYDSDNRGQPHCPYYYLTSAPTKSGKPHPKTRPTPSMKSIIVRYPAANLVSIRERPCSILQSAIYTLHFPPSGFSLLLIAFSIQLKSRRDERKKPGVETPGKENDAITKPRQRRHKSDFHKSFQIRRSVVIGRP